MRRLMLGLAVSLLTFCVAVWLVSGAGVAEQPPWRGCAALSSAGAIPTISLCDIARAPEQFFGKVVRVRAEFGHDAGAILLDHVTAGCGASTVLYAGLDESFGACDGALKELSVHSGFGTWYDGSAEVTVVGRYGRIETENSFYTGEVGFTIMCLERAEQRKMGAAASVFYGALTRVYHSVGRVSRYILGTPDNSSHRTAGSHLLIHPLLSFVPQFTAAEVGRSPATQFEVTP